MGMGMGMGMDRSTVAPSPGQWLSERPAAVVMLLIGLQALLWTVIPALSFASLPLDVVENLLWGREWQWGYAKHPPLQAWLTQAALMLSGGADWGVYLAAQVCLALTYLALFLLARDLGGPGRAALGVMLFSLVFYAHIPTPELNANVVQMPAWALAGLALWRALERDSPVWWLTLGGALALGLYGKYSVVFLMAALALALLTHPKGWRVFARPGPWLAAVVSLALVAPHLVWLADSGGQPIAYAMSRAAPLEDWRRLGAPAMFLLAQVANHAGMMVVLGLGLMQARRRGGTWPDSAAAGPMPPRGRRFVLVLAIAPLAVMVLYSGLAGVALRDMWGAPAVVWISPAAALALPEGLARRVIAAVAALWLALVVVLPLGVGAAALWGPSLSEQRPLRVSWPARSLARDLVAIWDRETGGRPLTLVGGQTWRAGLVLHNGGLQAGASGFIDLDPARNPWVSADRVAREGMLVVWRGGNAPDYAMPGPVAARGVLETPFPGAPEHTVRTGWAVIAPTDAHGAVSSGQEPAR